MNLSNIKAGRAWVFGDNVDTDQIAPGVYMKSSLSEQAIHCLEVTAPGFSGMVNDGDILVAGRNFGIGSSREQAVQVLTYLGISAVIAKSCAGIFKRNAFNLGLLTLECPDICRIKEGQYVKPDPIRGTIINQTTGENLKCHKVPDFLLRLLEDGGMIPHLMKKLKKMRP